jgi:DNA repair exonuclease SbcCD ATPase subunit
MMTIHDIENKTARLRTEIEKAKGKRDLLISQERQKQVELNSVNGNISTWEQVQLLLSRSSEYAREQLKAKIEETVTAALRCVFEDPGISFAIELGQSGGNPTANWQVISSYKDYEVAANPEDARGGGVTDIVSLALRLSLLELARPKHDGPVILDEPGKMISREYLPNVAAFLSKYGQKTGRQIIMITHHSILADAADVTWYVTHEKGVSKAEKVLGGEDQ